MKKKTRRKSQENENVREYETDDESDVPMKKIWLVVQPAEVEHSDMDCLYDGDDERTLHGQETELFSENSHSDEKDFSISDDDDDTDDSDC